MEQPKNLMAGEAERMNEKAPQEKTAEERAAHSEAVAFVERHCDYFEHYARGAVRFKPAPAGLGTFAFNLENNTIYVHSRFYAERGLSDEKTAFAVSHEAEHFLEKKQMLAEPDGAQRFARYLRAIKASKAYGCMDNCVADVRQNRAVISKTSRETAEIERDLYKKDLFPVADLTSEPKHIQFCDALLRESRVPDEQCRVSPEVREKLDTLRALKAGDEIFFELLTHPDTPMSLRLSLQNEYIWPVVKELLEKDEDERKKGGEESNGGKEGGEERETGEKEGKKEKPDPNEVFKDAYERASKRGMPESVPLEEIEKAFKEWREVNRASPLEKADREYVERLGVQKADLQKYRKIAAGLQDVRNPETGVSVVGELRDLIRRIIAKRLKKMPTPRYPVEEGEDLVDPAELVAEVRAGNLEPKVWETFEIQEKKGGRFGRVEMTLEFDRSFSMNDESGKKRREQQRAGVLGMEALKEISELCEEERANMAEPLEVFSEVYSFQADEGDAKPLKKMSKEFSERELIEIMKKLDTAPGGSTTDFVPLETMLAELEKDETARKKIAEGETKKIVIVFTDGESADTARVQAALEKLRGLGVVAVGVGITESGKTALTTYAPNARLALRAEDLPRILGELLREHLAEV
jgi:hypothetical protein